jgi:hypothetical protein
MTVNPSNFAAPIQLMLALSGGLISSCGLIPSLAALIWPKVTVMHIDTVLSPVYWELIEPAQIKITQKSNYAVRR